MQPDELEKNLGYTFRDRSLLVRALTHTSYAYEKYSENSHLKSNERLEFVGDAVVSLIVATYLYETYPMLPEGKMSRLRASVVCEEALSKMAEEIGLPKFLKLGVGEYQTGGKHKPSIVSDAMESVVAAIYMDSDYETVRGIMLPRFIRLIDGFGPDLISHDYKSALQEKAAAKGTRPVYAIVEESGPAHDRQFTAEVSVELQGVPVTERGVGRSKKDAEQAAAGNLLKTISGESPE